MSRLTINSNIPSLNAQRNLGNASKSLETSFTRLSSGLRINKASDDAAGLSISESSTLTRTQILQQSATSILAQANQQPSLVLSLLRDL